LAISCLNISNSSVFLRHIIPLISVRRDNLALIRCDFFFLFLHLYGLWLKCQSATFHRKIVAMIWVYLFVHGSLSLAIPDWISSWLSVFFCVKIQKGEFRPCLHADRSGQIGDLTFLDHRRLKELRD
jgi:hypothetical protein